MSESPDLDEVHGLLLHLCEEDLPWSDQAQLCVMDAFNDLSEFHAPTRVLKPSVSEASDRLGRAVNLLDGLVQRSQQLDRTLELMRVQGLVRQALVGSR